MGISGGRSPTAGATPGPSRSRLPDRCWAAHLGRGHSLAASAQTVARLLIEEIATPGRRLNADSSPNLSGEGLLRLHHDGIAIDLASHQDMIADQFDGIDRPAQTVGRAGADHPAIFRPEAQPHALAGPYKTCRQGSVGGLEAPALQLAADEVHGRRADETGDENIGWIVVDAVRRIDLLEPPLIQNGDPMAERHGLDLIMGDIDRRHP